MKKNIQNIQKLMEATQNSDTDTFTLDKWTEGQFSVNGYEIANT